VGTNYTSNSTADQTPATSPSSGSPDPAALRLSHIHGIVVQLRDLERSLAFAGMPWGSASTRTTGCPQCCALLARAFRLWP